MSKNVVGQRPNKYWPIVAGVGLVALFLYLGVSHQKHETTSGDQSHKFANGGSIADGNKKVVFNPNNGFAYNGSSSNRTLVQLLVSVLLPIIIWVYWWWNSPQGKCGNGECEMCT